MMLTEHMRNTLFGWALLQLPVVAFTGRASLSFFKGEVFVALTTSTLPPALLIWHPLLVQTVQMSFVVNEKGVLYFVKSNLD